jgi:diketogulonate reductase-like aldo/keto reductase
VEAWSPLGRTRVLEDPLVLELAEKYGKTPAQICLRFCLQNNILPLPKSSSPERMKQNLELFDFDIELEDIFRLMTMPETGWSGQHPEHF